MLAQETKYLNTEPVTEGIPVQKLNDFDSATAAKEFNSAGCLELPGVLEPELVQGLRDHFNRYARQPDRSQPYISVGAQRQMFPIQIEGPFNDPRIYGNPAITQILSAVLGSDFVLGCYTCVVAGPGAPEQHLHRDSPGLFQNPVDFFCPSFAVNLFIPLIDLTAETGTTRLRPESHRQAEPKHAPVEPYLETGSVLLMDYRVEHQGTQNRTNAPRPILCLAYTRPWFIDRHHFTELDPINISPTELDRVPEEHRNLFVQATDPPPLRPRSKQQDS